MYMAGTRHFWWWLGVRPIDRANVDSLLEAKCSVAMVPGGISETMVMQPGTCDLLQPCDSGLVLAHEMFQLAPTVCQRTMIVW